MLVEKRKKRVVEMMLCQATASSRPAEELEVVQWDGCSYRVPKLISESSAPMTKNQFYLRTVAAIRDGGGSYSTKAGALATRFAVGPATLTTAKASFAQLFDSQTREINLTDKDVFRMDDFQLYKLQGKPIDFGHKDKRLSRRDRVQG